MDMNIRTLANNLKSDDYPLVSSTLMHRLQQSEPDTLDDVALLVAEDYATSRGQQIEPAELGSTNETRQQKFVESCALGPAATLDISDDLVDILERVSGILEIDAGNDLQRRQVTTLVSPHGLLNGERPAGFPRNTTDNSLTIWSTPSVFRFQGFMHMATHLFDGHSDDPCRLALPSR